MENNITMHPSNAISASLAECFVTIDGNRYNFMQAIDLEAKFERIKSEIPVLGKPGRGNKSVGWKGTGSATFHFNSSIFRKLMERYQDTGEDVYFDIQIIDVYFTSVHSNPWVFDTGSVAKISNSKRELQNEQRLVKGEVTMCVGSGSKIDMIIIAHSLYFRD